MAASGDCLACSGRGAISFSRGIMNTNTKPVCLDDFERHAHETLPKLAWDYYSSGAVDEQTLRDNREAFNRWRLRPRILRDVTTITTSSTILGHPISTPIGIAAAAMQRMAHPDGEEATSRSASRYQIPMTLSMYSTASLEDVIACRGGETRSPYWLQLYVFKDRRVSEGLIRRAEKAGYEVVAVTVDTPLLGKRLADTRNKFHLPKPWRLANFDSTPSDTVDPGQNPPPLPDDDGMTLSEVLATTSDTSLNWESDITWLRSITKMKIVLKGVMTAEDAELAVKYGVDAVVVSNHGGRQLDGVLATIDALPEVVRAVRGRLEVYMDGGIRRGTDVFKALALGAKAVFIGRPVLWGLAYGGEDGLNALIEMLNEEFKLTMALAGCASLSDITPSHLVHMSEYTNARPKL